MANMIQVFQAYSPRVKVVQMIQVREVGVFIEGRSTWVRSEITGALLELGVALKSFLSAGNSVRLEGIGSFAPSVDRNGVIRITYRPDKELLQELNSGHGFHGKIRNKDMIGKSDEEFIARWNREHPDDPLEIPPKKDKKK